MLSIVAIIFPEALSDAQEAASQNYVVQYGDTLWDIAGEQLHDPFRWREIHQNNPHIVNPNLIYPGDIVGIYAGASDLRGSQTSETGGAAAQRVKRPLSDKAIARPWYGLPVPEPKEVKTPPFPTPLVPTTDFIEIAGYIVPYTQKQLRAQGFGQITGVQVEPGEDYTTIIRSEYGQSILSFGDHIYLNRGTKNNIREGDTFFGFRPVREIRHPLTSEVLGTQIEILGHLRVETLEDSVSSAEIVKSFNYMEVGTPLMPTSELLAPMSKPLLGDSRSYGFKVGNQLVGHIVAERIGRNNPSFHDIVYLDVGAAQGVQPADNFIIYRELEEGFPKQSIGRLTVLSTQKQTSTAIITENRKLIDLGEKVVLMR